ncbi:MAG: hypothetical protein HC809_12515 [Gammaproteobacteria bacterium]|nr:hypothetical protein [Gammaproteobacteria bacterium]
MDRILNQGLDEDRQVDREDISMLLLSGLEQTRLYASLSERTGEYFAPEDVLTEFKKYLYGKYLYRKTG